MTDGTVSVVELWRAIEILRVENERLRGLVSAGFARHVAQPTADTRRTGETTIDDL